MAPTAPRKFPVPCPTPTAVMAVMMATAENSKLVVMFGNNPAETRMSGGGITYLLEKAREKSNAKMIVIDPRYTDTAAGREDEWLPIRPGTDAALVAGIA
ncbi:hypothetical protein EYF18_23145 [Shigella flexneri]|nr:hypothetical protein [Shigella flexneri]EGA6741767.1 hypothetical protein [Shigella flexneri]